jgi:predicted dehydrogenase
MTERYEITSILQRELARTPDVFGTLEKGTADKPAVVMESVHHFFKEVSGKPLTRPAWFFDARQQGEAIPDVGTHLVDLVQWECFPDQALDWKKDIKVLSAHRWPTMLTREQFKRVTGLDAYPDFLKMAVEGNGALNVFENGEVTYTLRGVHVKVTPLWRFEAPAGAKDTHYSMLRGTRAVLTIKQTEVQHFQPTLYVENKSGSAAADFERTLRAAVTRLAATWPGIEFKPAGDVWEIVVPQQYSVGHEAHFAQVTERFLRFLEEGKMPDWEVPNMLAKYYTTTEGYRLSNER